MIIVLETVLILIFLFMLYIALVFFLKLGIEFLIRRFISNKFYFKTIFKISVNLWFYLFFGSLAFSITLNYFFVYSNLYDPRVDEMQKKLIDIRNAIEEYSQKNNGLEKLVQIHSQGNSLSKRMLTELKIINIFTNLKYTSKECYRIIFIKKNNKYEYYIYFDNEYNENRIGIKKLYGYFASQKEIHDHNAIGLCVEN